MTIVVPGNTKTTEVVIQSTKKILLKKVVLTVVNVEAFISLMNLNKVYRIVPAWLQ